MSFKFLKLSIKGGIILLALCIICLIYISCYDNNRISGWEIQKRVGTLIEAKASQCNNRPSVPLFFTREATPNEVEDCENAIIGINCPFKSYPWTCVRIF